MGRRHDIQYLEADCVEIRLTFLLCSIQRGHNISILSILSKH
jgi:hypothetical protein